MSWQRASMQHSRFLGLRQNREQHLFVCKTTSSALAKYMDKSLRSLDHIWWEFGSFSSRKLHRDLILKRCLEPYLWAASFYHASGRRWFCTATYIRFLFLTRSPQHCGNLRPPSEPRRSNLSKPSRMLQITNNLSAEEHTILRHWSSEFK
jgi:hypothetical protein